MQTNEWKKQSSGPLKKRTPRQGLTRHVKDQYLYGENGALPFVASQATWRTREAVDEVMSRYIRRSLARTLLRTDQPIPRTGRVEGDRGAPLAICHDDGNRVRRAIVAGPELRNSAVAATNVELDGARGSDGGGRGGGGRRRVCCATSELAIDS